jgi:uncharacterized protein
MRHHRERTTRLFLDANVLISAARKEGSKVTQLWHLQNTELVTSEYILTECRRNLPGDDQQERLEQLLRSVRIMEMLDAADIENSSPIFGLLPEKDRPVLAGAVLAGADFLITGDKRHFGAWYGAAMLGVRVEPPGNITEILRQTPPASG